MTSAGGGGCAGAAELALEHASARGGPEIARIREREWRGAEQAARRTIWSPDSPAASKGVAADGAHGDDYSVAHASFRQAIRGEEGEDAAAELGVGVDLSEEMRSGGNARRRRRRLRPSEGGRGEGGGSAGDLFAICRKSRVFFAK